MHTTNGNGKSEPSCNTWVDIDGNSVDPDTITGYWGFVYLITNNLTGQRYIGKKFFTAAARRQVKGKKKKYRKPSDWETYFGSNARLLEDTQTLGHQNFIRQILFLCKTRGECSYVETYLILKSGALLDTAYYNDWVSAKLRRTHLKDTDLKKRLDKLAQF